MDPLDRVEGDSPLHKAVRYVNGLDKDDWAGAAPLVELLVEAGADVRYVRCLLSEAMSQNSEGSVIRGPARVFVLTLRFFL